MVLRGNTTNLADVVVGHKKVSGNRCRELKQPVMIHVRVCVESPPRDSVWGVNKERNVPSVSILSDELDTITFEETESIFDSSNG